MQNTITNTLLLCCSLLWSTTVIAFTNPLNPPVEEIIYNAVFEGTGEVVGKANGTKGGTWTSTPKNGCANDGNEFFGTRNDKFEITNYEGTGCDYSGRQGGANDSEWNSGTINIKEYTNVNVIVQISGTAAKGGFEDNPKVCPPAGACVDQISVFVSLDGENFSKVYRTNENNFKAIFEEAKGLCGEKLVIRVEGGTQAANESFFIDRVMVTGTKGTLPIASQPEKVCYGEDVVLSIKNVKNTAKIKWYDPNDAEITSAENSKLLTLSNIQPKDAGFYHALVVDEELDCGKKEVKLDFEVAVANGLSGVAEIVLALGETYACKGENITLRAQPNNRLYDYVWFGPDGNEIPYCKGAAVCRISDIEESDAGKYVVKISDPKTGICTLDEAAINLQVIEGSGEVSMVGDNPFSAGSTAKVKVKTENSGKYNYVWTFPNGNQQAATEINGTLILKGIRPEDAGIYKLSISNVNNTCKSEVEYLINVEGKASAPTKKVENTEHFILKTTKTSNANAVEQTKEGTEEKTIPVNLHVPIFEAQKSNVIIEEGNVVEFTQKGTLQAKTDLEDATYKWYKNGVLVSETATLEVHSSGNYTVIIQSKDGVNQSSAFTKVEVSGRSYTVKMGDDLERIARLFYQDQTKVELLKTANNIKGDDIILKIGTKLIIPNDEVSLEVNQNEILISAAADFAPFSGKMLHQQGILSEVTKRVFEEMQVDVGTSYMNWNQVKAATLNGHTLGAFPLLKNDKNEQHFIFSEALYKVSNVFFERKGTNTDFSKPTKLKGKKVAILQGYEIPELTDWYKKKYIQIRVCKSLAECFELLDKGTVDLVATAQFVGLNQLKMQYGAIDYFDTVSKGIGTGTLHFAMPKQHSLAAKIVNQFNEKYKVLKEQGVIRAIEDRHVDLIQKN